MLHHGRKLPGGAGTPPGRAGAAGGAAGLLRRCLLYTSFEAAQKFETPFHLYSERGIRRTARALRDAFGEIEDFREYFAVKALPTPAILRILREEGCGVDCASETELMLADACGFAGGDIMFSANAVSYTHLDEELYARFLCGEDEALGQLMERYFERLTLFCATFLNLSLIHIYVVKLAAEHAARS